MELVDIKDRKEIGCKVVVGIHLAQDRV